MVVIDLGPEPTDEDKLANMLEEMQHELSLDEWALLIDAWAQIKGWNEDRDQAEWATLAHTEISEAYEEHRKGNPPEYVYRSEGRKPEGMSIEYADLMIRILHWFARHNISVEEAIRLKMEYNLTRPFRHGGKVS